MQKIFYIFRHGETDYNLAKRWQGCSIDAPLNQTGIEQAELLAEKMKNFGLEVVFSSPLHRALKTAEIVAKKSGVRVKTMSELVEASVGVCEGLSVEEVASKYPDLWQRWYNEMDMNDRWPEGESKMEIQQRMQKAFAKLLQQPEKVIGVASHGGSMRYFLYAFGYGPHRMPNTALFRLVYEDGNWDLEQI